MSSTQETQTIRQGLSTRESRLLSHLAAEGHQIISIDDVEATLEVAPNTAREIASRLTEKGWLDRLLPGRYLIIPLAAGEEAVYTTLNVANLEKTLVDCADHPEYCGGIRELATAMVAADDQDCSWATVGEYLQRLDNGAATKRIVYLADQLGIDLPTRETLVESFTSGYSLLDPTQSGQGSYDSEYRLRINVDPGTLGPTES